MKKILIVHTGGTIGSSPERHQRDVNVAKAKKILFENFAASASPNAALADILFEEVPLGFETLSENMTVAKWNAILSHLSRLDFSAFCGAIVLHGTDTLAYSAALFALALGASPIPVMLVSGNKPPVCPDTNANANFAAAVDLIMQNIAPNVYVPYRNADGKMYLHLGATLLQCPVFSDDFCNADHTKCFVLSENAEEREALFSACVALSARRAARRNVFLRLPENSVLMLSPHVGLDYARISMDRVQAVLHTTYHSGTLCVKDGAQSADGAHSFLWFAKRAKQMDVPIFLAPCFYNDDKYSSTADAVEIGGAVPLAMTAETAYAKLLIALAAGMRGTELVTFMKTDLCTEQVFS